MVSLVLLDNQRELCWWLAALIAVQWLVDFGLEPGFI